jgi:hypothetical protein
MKNRGLKCQELPEIPLDHPFSKGESLSSIEISSKRLSSL